MAGDHLRLEGRDIGGGRGRAFSASAFSGILAAGVVDANEELFHFRGTSTTQMTFVKRVRVSAAVSTTFFAAGEPLLLGLYKANAWTAIDAGGTSFALDDNTRVRGMGISQMTNFVIADTDVLSAGTKQLDTTPLATVMGACPITNSLDGTIIPPGTVLWQADQAAGEAPLILGGDEGLVIISELDLPATGTWRLCVSVDWAEHPGTYD